MPGRNEASPGQAAPNPYQAIASKISGRIGSHVYYSTRSTTQRVAAELAGEGADQGVVVIAERQIAGRRASRSRLAFPRGCEPLHDGHLAATNAVG